MKKIKVESREFGAGAAKPSWFTTYKGLQCFVQARWQGPDYLDSGNRWHTDECAYRIVGADLEDIGHFEQGAKDEDGYEVRVWVWKPLDWKSYFQPREIPDGPPEIQGAEAGVDPVPEILPELWSGISSEVPKTIIDVLKRRVWKPLSEKQEEMRARMASR